MIKFATPKGGAAGVFSLMLAASLLLFLPGCQGPLGVQETAGTGTLSVTVEGPPPGAQARTALPGGDLVYDFYRLVFTFTPGAGNTRTFAPVTRPGVLGAIQILGIPEGLWDLTVTAYLEGETVPTASYTYTGLDIAPNDTSSPTRPLSLSPAAGGYGEFRWDVTFPDTVTEFTVDVFTFAAWMADGDSLAGFPREFESGTPGWSMYDGNVTVTGYLEDLPSGVYWVYFTLSGGGHTARPGTILRVYRNMVSVFDRTLAFDPATAPERAIRAINDHPAWGAVSQAWDTDTATTAAGALAQVQTQVNAVVAGLGAPAVVDWDSAAPTPGQTGIPAANIVFAVTVGGEETSITVSVAFLWSNAQAALAAINTALTAIQAPFTQPWLVAGTQATLDAAIATVSGRVNAAITNATAIVSFDDAPTPVGDAIPEDSYVFTVVITGNDTTTYTTTVVVLITFAADGVVVTQTLEDLYDEALAMLGTAVASTNGANVPMANLWTTPALRDALEQARTAAGLVLEAHLTDDATQGDVDGAYGVLRPAYNAFRDARRAGRQELVAAHTALENRVAYIAPLAGNYTPTSWAPVAAALGTANNLLETNPLDLGLLDTALAGILAGLQNAYTALNTAFGGDLVLVVDYNAVNAAYTAATGALPASAANEAAVVAAVTAAIGDGTINVTPNLTTVAAGIGVPGSITGTITLSRGNASRTVTGINVAIPALPVPDTVVITWTGFTNPLLDADLGYTITGGTITLVNHDGLNIRWFDGANEITGFANGGVLTMARLPSFVTVRATVDMPGIGNRTFSFVIETD